MAEIDEPVDIAAVRRHSAQGGNLKGPEDWTDEVVDRFWRRMATNGVGYFSEFNAQGIVRFMELSGALRGRILDWGCGNGALLERLSEHPVEIWGVDASAMAVETTRSRMTGRAAFGGVCRETEVRNAFQDSSFDTVTCIETLEHAGEESLEKLFTEIHRILRPGGRLIASTPNEEELNIAAVYCPFCDSTFHPMQHVRSWSSETLAIALGGAGFTVELCRGLRFESFQRWSAFEASSTEVLGVLKANLLGRLDPLWRVLDRLTGRRFPRNLEFAVRCSPGRHLIALARKP